MEFHKYFKPKKKKKKLSQQRRGQAWWGRSSEEGQEVAGRVTGGTWDWQRPG